MFDGLGYNILAKLIASPLEVETVVNSILDGIRTQQEWIVLPSHLKYLAAVNMVLPIFINDFLLSLIGGVYGMESYKGKSKKSQ
jgi:hypothetical protein